MSTTEQTATAGTPSGAETPARDWSALAVELGDAPETAAPATPTAPTTPSVETPAATTATPPAETPAVPAVADEALQRLDELIQTEQPAASTEVKPDTVPPTPELQQLEYWAKNPDFAKEAVNATVRYFALEQAASQNDVPGVLNQFAPAFRDALMNHIYEQHKEAFVERFIAEKEGRGPQSVMADPRVARLEQQLNQVTSLLTDRQKRETQAEQLNQSSQRQQALQSHWDKLFSTVNVTDAEDRLFLEGAVMRSLSRDPKAVQHIQEGRWGDISVKFRELYPKWRDKQKAIQTATSQVRDQQEQKKSGQLVTSATPTSETTLVATEPDVDENGHRTQSFWKSALAKVGLD